MEEQETRERGGDGAAIAVDTRIEQPDNNAKATVASVSSSYYALEAHFGQCSKNNHAPICTTFRISTQQMACSPGGDLGRCRRPCISPISWTTESTWKHNATDLTQTKKQHLPASPPESTKNFQRKRRRPLWWFFDDEYCSWWSHDACRSTNVRGHAHFLRPLTAKCVDRLTQHLADFVDPEERAEVIRRHRSPHRVLIWSSRHETGQQSEDSGMVQARRTTSYEGGNKKIKKPEKKEDKYK